MTGLTTIAFDADDTLWHNERFFRLTQDHFAELLADYADKDHLMERLLQAESKNLGQYGFGIKGFVLSMIETAIEVTDQKVPASVIAELLATGQEMLRHPIELLPYARDAVEHASAAHKVLLITKGDLLHQEQKLAQSGLGDFFDGVEIVSDKTPDVYRTLFARHNTAPQTTMMIGNSMKSDVLPVVDIGGWGVFVPHGIVWHLEKADPPENAPKYRQITDLGALPDLLDSLT